MADDSHQVRDLITRWAEAVHDGDLASVLADHAADIVMFDVPPPHDGVRGIDAYRETWPPFFDWQRQGAKDPFSQSNVGQRATFDCENAGVSRAGSRARCAAG